MIIGGMQVVVPSEVLIPRGYPEQPDDGTWENEGGYVARRKPTAFVMHQPEYLVRALGHFAPKPVLYLDAESFAELELQIARQR